MHSAGRHGDRGGKSQQSLTNKIAAGTASAEQQNRLAAARHTWCVGCLLHWAHGYNITIYQCRTIYIRTHAWTVEAQSDPDLFSPARLEPWTVEARSDPDLFSPAEIEIRTVEARSDPDLFSPAEKKTGPSKPRMTRTSSAQRKWKTGPSKPRMTRTSSATTGRTVEARSDPDLGTALKTFVNEDRSKNYGTSRQNG